MARRDHDDAFTEFVSLRSTALHRTAYLLVAATAAWPRTCSRRP